MINVSSEFRRSMIENGGRWLGFADIALAGGENIRITNENLWQGGINIEDAVSSDSSFDIGSAIINKCTLTIENIYDEFSEYDFGKARVVVYIGLELPDGTVEKVRKGTYTVDEAKYDGSIITLSCLDYMSEFDKLYSNSQLKYPATMGSIILDACSVCGVPLNTYDFPRKDFVIETGPETESTTFREVISWCAQIACCFCRCDAYGRLELRWYDQESLEKSMLYGGEFDHTSEDAYQSGDSADGGGFKPWGTGYEFDGGTFKELESIHHIGSNYSISVSTDDVVITGVRVVEKTEGDSSESVVTYQAGTDGYVVSVEDNDLIHGGSGNSICGWIGEQIIGFRFRKAAVSHSSDPTIEAGDVAFLTDRKGNSYPIIVSSTNFSTGGAQNTVSAAEEPARNSAAGFSAATKNYVEYRKEIEKERTDREKALEDLEKRINESDGLFTTEEVLPSGGTVFYLHNKPSLADSDIVWKMTAEAFAVSTDGGKTYNAGLTVDGDLIARILTVIGINADWVKAGALRVEKNGKTMVNMDFDTGRVDMVVDSFSLTSGDTINSIAKDAANEKSKTFTSTPYPPYNVGDIWMGSSSSDIMTCINARSSGNYVSTDWEKRNKYIDQSAANSAASNAVNAQTQQSIFNKLTNNGQAQGIFLSEGKIYVNAEYIASGTISANFIRGGSLILGGANNTNGILSIRNASNIEIGRWDKDGVYINGGKIVSETTDSTTTIYNGKTSISYGNKQIGNIGTNYWEGYPSYRGVVFDLEASGAFTSWSAKTSDAESVYATRLMYANQSFSGFDAGKLYVSCNMDFRNYEIQNAYINALRVKTSLIIPNNVDCDIYSHVDFHNYEIQNAKINSLVGVNGKAPFTGQIKVLSSTGGAWGTFTVTDGIITSAADSIIYS